jgi:hypothetical protein
MNNEYPNLETVKHLILLQESSIPIDNYPEIVDNILNKQYLEFVERNRISTKQNNLTFSSNKKISIEYI